MHWLHALTSSRLHPGRLVHAQCVLALELRQQLHWQRRCGAIHADPQRESCRSSVCHAELQRVYAQVTDADQAFANFDSANALRLVQAEFQAFADQYNITATNEVASQTTTYSLVAPSSGWQTASPATVKTYVYSSAGASATATPAPAGSSSSSSSSSDSDDDSDSKVKSGDDDKLGSDLAANLDTSSGSGQSSGDSGALLRNSYIIIGLLGGAICLLLGVLIKLVVSSRNSKYRPVATAIPPAAFSRPYEPEKDEAFTTPYDDLARPTGSH